MQPRATLQQQDQQLTADDDGAGSARSYTSGSDSTRRCGAASRSSSGHG